MDHHCPWIYNCVGKNNYKLFIIFLVVCAVDNSFHAILFALVFWGAMSKFEEFFVVESLKEYLKYFEYFFFIVCVAIFLSVSSIILLHVCNCCKDKSRKMKMLNSYHFELSDTSSMLITPEVSNEVSLNNIIEIEKNNTKTGCFCQKSKKLSKVWYSMQTQ